MFEDSLVSPVRRSPIKPLLATIVVLGLAAGAWWMFGRGKGQPEDPARVLIVGPTPELAGYLERQGFDVDYLSFGAAVGEGQAFDSGLDDLAAILEYADQTGIGYVALSMAHGERYDFADHEYPADDPPAGTTFAVIGVGDLDRHVSYGGVPPEVAHEHPIDEQVGLLLALFGQPEISKARTNQAVNDLMIRFGSARTVATVTALEKGQEIMRRQVAEWTALAEQERGDQEPIELARPFERLLGWPLANGAILLGSARGSWRSDDGLDAHWDDEGATIELSVVSPSTLDQRSSCPALPDTLPFDDDVAISASGDALLLPTNAYVAELWVLAGDGCGFERRDEIRRLDRGALGQPRANGRTAASQDGRLSWADAKQRSYRSAEIGGVLLRPDALAWVADDIVVVPASLDFAAAAEDRRRRAIAAAAEAGLPIPEFEPVEPTEPIEPTDAIAFIRLPPRDRDADIELAVIPIDALTGGEPASDHVRAVFPITGAVPTVVIFVDTPDGLQLIRASLDATGPAWQPGLAPDFDLTVAVEAGRAAMTVEWSARDIPLDAFDLVVSPTGSHAAWSQHVGNDAPPDGPSEAGKDTAEIFVLALGRAAQPLRMTDNDRRDDRPRFAGLDGRLLLFSTGYWVDDAFTEIESIRALLLQ